MTSCGCFKVYLRGVRAFCPGRMDSWELPAGPQEKHLIGQKATTSPDLLPKTDARPPLIHQLYAARLFSFDEAHMMASSLADSDRSQQEELLRDHISRSLVEQLRNSNFDWTALQSLQNPVLRIEACLEERRTHLIRQSTPGMVVSVAHPNPSSQSCRVFPFRRGRPFFFAFVTNQSHTATALCGPVGHREHPIALARGHFGSHAQRFVQFGLASLGKAALLGT